MRSCGSPSAHWRAPQAVFSSICMDKKHHDLWEEGWLNMKDKRSVRERLGTAAFLFHDADGPLRDFKQMLLVLNITDRNDIKTSIKQKQLFGK